MKTAVVVLSDPKTGSEESLGRLFNALAAAHDFKRRGDAVQVLFQGAGTRWVEYLAQPDHPAHALFESVRDAVAGVSCGCADVFGARQAAEDQGFALLRDNPLPGTSGVSSLAALAAAGYTVLTF